MLDRKVPPCDGGWTHPICVRCWNRAHPSSQTEDTKQGAAEVCCWCAAVTYSGIYLREDPNKLHLQDKEPPL